MEELPTAYVFAFGLASLVVAAGGLWLLRRVGRRPRRPSQADAYLLAGQVLGVALVAAAATRESLEGESVKEDLRWLATLSVAGLAFLFVAGEVGVRLLLSSHLDDEVRRGNAAAGIAAGATYASTGIVGSFALSGRALSDIGLSAAFFVLGIVTLHGLGALFRSLTTYDDAEQIRGENCAAAVSYGGALLAFALIIARSLEGPFEGWPEAARGFGEVLVACVGLYPIRQLVIQSLLLGAPLRLRGGRIDDEIADERNVAIASLEASAYVACALNVHVLL